MTKQARYLLLAVLLAAPASARSLLPDYTLQDKEPEPSDFSTGAWTVAVIPDTQNYTDPAALEAGHDRIFEGMLAWLAGHVDSRNIETVVHVGDMTDHNTPEQWKRVREVYEQIDGKCAYVLCEGNHDSTKGRKAKRKGTHAATRMNEVFAIDQNPKNKRAFGGSYENGKLENAWYTFERSGQKFLVLALEHLTRKDVIIWAGNCAPSRCALLTGQYPPRNHFYNVKSIHRGNKRSDRLTLNEVPDGLPPVDPKVTLPRVAEERVTFAEALKKAGYATAMYGKWHVGGMPPKGSGYDGGVTPAMQGFDEVVEGDPARSGHSRKAKGTDPKHVFSYSEHAINFIERSHAQKKPFLVYMAHHAVHRGNESTKESLKLFKERKARALAATRTGRHPVQFENRNFENKEIMATCLLRISNKSRVISVFCRLIISGLRSSSPDRSIAPQHKQPLTPACPS